MRRTHLPLYFSKLLLLVNSVRGKSAGSVGARFRWSDPPIGRLAFFRRDDFWAGVERRRWRRADAGRGALR